MARRSIRRRSANPLTPAPPGIPGGFLTISANGAQAGSGILWASMPYAEDADADVVSGVLRAFDASDLTHELWNTRMVPARDDLGNFAKFVPPTVANGRVYVATFSNRLLVYGLLASIPPATGGAIIGAGTSSSAAVNLTDDRNIGLGALARLRRQGQRQRTDQRFRLPRCSAEQLQQRSAHHDVERRDPNAVRIIYRRGFRHRDEQRISDHGSGRYRNSHA